MDSEKDHGFERMAELWEYTDGCLFLIREISTLPE
jgi:hypothetical protein